MKDRKKRTLVIGILCCLLVFMGVGFAVMNATLNINGTATAINTWDVRMTNIEVTEKSEGATNEEDTKINEDGISANFNTDFTKPGDFITYKVTIENKGSIDAVLNDISITLNVSEADKNLFNITDTRPNNQLLEAGTSTTFTIKVEFRSDADRMPSGDIEYVVKVDYSQQTGEVGGEEEDWTFKVDESGTIVAYNYEKGQDVVVPAEVDGIPVKKITDESFEYTNVIYYQNASTGQVHAVIYEEEPSFSIVKDKALTLLAYDTCGSIACLSQIEAATTLYSPEDYNFPEGITNGIYVNPDPNVDVTSSLDNADSRIRTLDLSDAIYLETIGDGAFSHSGEDEISLREVIFPENGVLKTIGNSAFLKSGLTNIVIPASVETIGSSAFGHDLDTYDSPNRIRNVTFVEGNLKEIGGSAFFGNQITSLIIPSSVIKIYGTAFYNQNDSEGNATLQSVIVKRSKEDFLANVTVSDNWFDNSLITEPTYDPS